jgi:hypothetical protein|tara:strand:- start:1364 stop:1624 length:261 start_codon:yes stop_codon:yes gene_type:complete
MYITLSQTSDRDGFQGQVALNVNRINGFREVSYKDIGGNSEKDQAGYVGTYTEVLMKGATVLVADPIPSILEKIHDSKMRDDRNRS